MQEKSSQETGVKIVRDMELVPEQNYNNYDFSVQLDNYNGPRYNMIYDKNL